MNGKGIIIRKDGGVHVGYVKMAQFSPGNFITIYTDGKFRVGEFYMKDGHLQ